MVLGKPRPITIYLTNQDANMLDTTNISPETIQPQCVCCTEPAEWAQRWCQEHWEAECSRTWWEMVMGRGGIKLSDPKSPHI
jgi:hypothetical protein